MKVTSLPATRALAAMLIAALVVVGIAVLLTEMTNQRLDLRFACALHGVLSLVVVWWWGLPWWWRFIAVIFAPAVGIGLELSLPGWAWGFGFIVIAGLSWGAVVTRVPLFLSTTAIWSQVTTLVPQTPVRVIDLGSGLGGLVLHLARQRPAARVEGIEVAPVTWLIGWLRARCRRSPVRMRFGDYRRLDFSAYDVVFAFLSPAAMPDLWTKASAEMRTGTILVSCEFDIPGAPLARRIEIPGERPVLIWTMPGPAT